MGRRNILPIIGTMLLFLVMAGCDKTERKTKKFIKEGRWHITELTAGTTIISDLPKWDIYACENHEEYCTGKWNHPNGSSTNFFWKFYNIGGNFIFMADSLESEKGTMAYAQCLNFSGDYKAKKSKAHEFHFESLASCGYPGKLVTILMEGN